MVSLSIVESISVHKPVLAEENIIGHFPVPSVYIPKGELSYVLKIHGDSMVDAGILDGVMSKQNAATRRIIGIS